MMPFGRSDGPDHDPLGHGPGGADPSDTIEVSFEFFPPKTKKMVENLKQTAAALSPLAPRFVSMTYGAGGSTRDRTLAVTADLVRQTHLPVAGHLTCVDATRDDVDDVARAYWANGIRHVVALRGDPAVAGGRFSASPDGYRNAVDLVAGLKRIAPFEISVAAYPEVHPEASSAQADLDNLKAKLDAGATRAITQFFFEAGTFLRFRDRAAAAGVEAEIVPGILPISNIAQAYKFAGMCGAHIPDWMRRTFHGLDEHPDIRALVATSVASELCRQLQAEGVSSFHFYTLNRAEPSYALCRLLGKQPAARVMAGSAGLPEAAITS
jgi:methylenetetrahydrofolate reductase (NADPH)